MYAWARFGPGMYAWLDLVACSTWFRYVCLNSTGFVCLKVDLVQLLIQPVCLRSTWFRKVYLNLTWFRCVCPCTRPGLDMHEWIALGLVQICIMCPCTLPGSDMHALDLVLCILCTAGRPGSMHSMHSMRSMHSMHSTWFKYACTRPGSMHSMHCWSTWFYALYALYALCTRPGSDMRAWTWPNSGMCVL